MNILKIWQHPDSHSDVAARGPRYVIAAVSLFNFVANCVFVLINAYLHTNQLPALLQLSTMSLTLASLRLFRSHHWAAHIFLGCATINMCALVFTYINFPYISILWLPVYTIFSVFVVGLRAGGVWSFLATSGVSVLLLYGRQWNPSPLTLRLFKEPPVAIVSVYVTSATAFITAMLFVRSIQALVQMLKKQNDELQRRNEIIQAYAQDKAMLVSVLTHDIATPLTIIQHSSEFAKRNLTDVSTHLERIERASQVLCEISRSVREFQAVEEGRMALPLSAVNLDLLMSRVLYLNEDRLHEKSLTLEWARPENGSLFVLAEEKTLCNSVINNILSNAIKFSFMGQKIVMKAIVETDFIELQIRDFGVGIADDKLKSLFNPQGPRSTLGTWGEKGTGFGLSISKSYVEKYGGELRVESVEKKQDNSEHGTTVSLRLRRTHPVESSQPCPADEEKARRFVNG